MKSFIWSIALVLAIGIVGSTAAAQITVMERSSGERTAISESPHTVVDKMMVRAVATQTQTDTIRWALVLYGTDGEADAEVTLDDEPIKPLRITTDAEAPGGRTRIFLDENDFYRLANRSAPTVRVGEASFELPEAVQQDMRAIHERIL